MFGNPVLTRSMLKLAAFAVVELCQNHTRALVDVLSSCLRTGLQHRRLPQSRFAITSSRSIFGKRAEPCCVSLVQFKAFISLLPVHRVAAKGPLNRTACEEATGVLSALHLRSIYEKKKTLLSYNISAVWDEVFLVKCSL